MTSAEIRLQRKQTTAYIAADSVPVVLNRVALVPNNAGGFQKGSITPLPVQTVRLIDQQAQRQRILADGESVNVSYVMMMEWDADVEEGDWFMYQGHKYEVTDVGQKRAYETLCEVYDRG